MRNVLQAFFFVLLGSALVSCSAFAPVPTQTPASTATSLPTATSTLQPTPTLTAVPVTAMPDSFVFPMPEGKPAEDWQGIPVMPGALAGQSDANSYAFTIQATPDEIQQFYLAALEKLGWTMLAASDGESDSVLLVFMKDANTLSVSIFSQADGVMYVLLIK